MKHLDSDTASRLTVALARGVCELAEGTVKETTGEESPCCVAQLMVMIGATIIIRARRKYPEFDSELRDLFKEATEAGEAQFGLLERRRSLSDSPEELVKAIEALGAARGLKLEVVTLKRVDGKGDGN